MVELLIVATLYSGLAVHNIPLPDLASCYRIKEAMESKPEWYENAPTIHCTCVELWPEEGEGGLEPPAAR